MVGEATTRTPSGNGRASGLPAEMARGHVEASVARIPATDTVEQALSRLRRVRYVIVDVVLVVDQQQRYVGVAPIGELLAAAPDRAVSDVVRRDWPIADPELDQELALERAVAAGVTTLPIVDGAGHALGCIPAHALIEILAAEHREDVHRMVGILREGANSRHAIEDPPFTRFRRRFPWLVIGLALSTAGTAVMAGFEEMLARNVVVAFFIPALVYLTDAIGTQTEAIAVRGLSMTQKSFPDILMREIATGGMIGGALAVLAMSGIWLVYGDLRLAVGVGLSLVVAGTLACAIGLTLPWILSRLHIDPALGSGPVATIIQDVLTLLVYFSILTTLLAP